MNILLNNKEINVPDNFKVKDLIKLLNYLESVAVFINGKQILISEYFNFEIKAGDIITIFKPLGGG